MLKVAIHTKTCRPIIISLPSNVWPNESANVLRPINPNSARIVVFVIAADRQKNFEEADPKQDHLRTARHKWSYSVDKKSVLKRTGNIGVRVMNEQSGAPAKARTRTFEFNAGASQNLTNPLTSGITGAGGQPGPWGIRTDSQGKTR
jgi:hypothetical protein